MAYVYCVTNKLSGKQYVGKTYRDINTRFKEHVGDSRSKSRKKDRPLARAIKKYGEDAFIVSLLDEGTLEEMTKREVYWIAYLGTYENGYNATTGGDGKPYIDHDLVISLYTDE